MRTSTSSSLPTAGRLDARVASSIEHLHVRRLGEPALLARPRGTATATGWPPRGRRSRRPLARGDRCRRPASGASTARRRARCRRRRRAGGRSRGALLLAVAVPVAAAQRVHVEHGRPGAPSRRGRRATARVPIRGRGTGSSGCACASAASSALVRWLTQIVLSRQPARRSRVHPATTSRPAGSTVGAVQRQVEGEALEARRRSASRSASLAGGRLGDAVPAHRGQHLDDDPVRRRSRASGLERCDDRCGSPGRGRGHRRRATAGRCGVSTSTSPPKYVSRTAATSLDRCRPRPCRRRAGSPRAAEPLVAEAVAVALEDRHEAGNCVDHARAGAHASARCRRTA